MSSLITAARLNGDLRLEFFVRDAHTALDGRWWSSLTLDGRLDQVITFLRTRSPEALHAFSYCFDRNIKTLISEIQRERICGLSSDYSNSGVNSYFRIKEKVYIRLLNYRDFELLYAPNVTVEELKQEIEMHTGFQVRQQAFFWRVNLLPNSWSLAMVAMPPYSIIDLLVDTDVGEGHADNEVCVETVVGPTPLTRK